MDNKNKILTGVVIILAIATLAMGWSWMNREGEIECPKCLVCENKTCPECPTCPEPVKCSVCKNVTCPECTEQKECPEVKCPDCEVCKQCLNVTCPECPKRSGSSCSCPACFCPEPEHCSVSNVSECRNDTIADFEIELYLNGILINEVRNGSYYYQNETIEAKVTPNRVIGIYINPPHGNNWDIHKYDAQNWIYIDYNKRMYRGLLCSDNITLCGVKQVLAPALHIATINCTSEWLLWNQTVYMAEMINCTNASNQSVEWNCIEPKSAEEGKYLVSFCYRINYTYPINLDDRDCIYKEFEIKTI